jgi:protein translocase SecG subunit
MEILYIIVQVVLALTSILLTLTILLHRGRGGGLSDMFGGGVSSNLGSSGVAAGEGADRVVVNPGTDQIVLRRPVVWSIAQGNPAPGARVRRDCPPRSARDTGLG